VAPAPGRPDAMQLQRYRDHVDVGHPFSGGLAFTTDYSAGLDVAEYTG
jgi:hypothetical protein